MMFGGADVDLWTARHASFNDRVLRRVAVPYQVLVGRGQGRQSPTDRRGGVLDLSRI